MLGNNTSCNGTSSSSNSTVQCHHGGRAHTYAPLACMMFIFILCAILFLLFRDKLQGICRRRGPTDGTVNIEMRQLGGNGEEQGNSIGSLCTGGILHSSGGDDLLSSWHTDSGTFLQQLELECGSLEDEVFVD
ncbi:MAG: hypothetical protein ACTJLM_01715 [Ehrlichia sp.]